MASKVKIYQWQDKTQAAEFKESCINKRIHDSDVDKTVGEIIANVRQEGQEAVLEYIKKWEYKHAKQLSYQQAKPEELDEGLKQACKEAYQNIVEFQSRLIERIKKTEEQWIIDNDNKKIGVHYRPYQRVGVYVPAGSAPLVSTVLMTAVCAKVAGVPEVVIATPANQDGKIHPAVHFVSQLVGCQEIYAMGGAHGIAALAYGTAEVKPVHKIVGPGNIYVTTAKKQVYGQVDIDMVAGPSEVCILADNTAQAKYCALDMCAQMEHDPLAQAICIVWDESLAVQVQKAYSMYKEQAVRKEIIEQAERFSAIILVKDQDQAVEVANQIAPEHLSLCIAEPQQVLSKVHHAGTVFLGHYSPEAAGDYCAGPSHVLPTAGSAKMFSGLSAGDFLKRMSVIEYTEQGLKQEAPIIAKLADCEGLGMHKMSVTERV